MDVDYVRRRFLEGESISSIARDVGRTPRRVQQVVADLQTTRPVPPPEIMDSLLVVMMRMHGPLTCASFVLSSTDIGVRTRERTACEYSHEPHRREYPIHVAGCIMRW